MPEATLTSKGQVTIPKAVRDHLKLEAGARVDFIITADGTVLLPEPLHRYFGADRIEPQAAAH